MLDLTPRTSEFSIVNVNRKCVGGQWELFADSSLGLDSVSFFVNAINLDVRDNFNLKCKRKKNARKILVGGPERKVPLLRPRHRWNGAKMYPNLVPRLIIHGCIPPLRRSQWPLGLRHELSSPARTLGSWVWIQLDAWMSVCVYSVFLLFCV
jgi:hypothetical protein